MPKRSNPAAVPPLERAVRSVAEVQAQHLQELPRSQLGIEWLTDRIGRPWFAYAIVAFILIWIGSDAMLARHGRFDATYFPLLQLLIGAFSLIMAAFILITENRSCAETTRPYRTAGTKKLSKWPKPSISRPRSKKWKTPRTRLRNARRRANARGVTAAARR